MFMNVPSYFSLKSELLISLWQYHKPDRVAPEPQGILFLKTDLTSENKGLYMIQCNILTAHTALLCTNCQAYVLRFTAGLIRNKYKNELSVLCHTIFSQKA